MEKAVPPQLGHPICDSILIVVWPVLIAVNSMPSAGVIADFCVAVGAGLGAVLTGLKIYEHVMGEQVSETFRNRKEA